MELPYACWRCRAWLHRASQISIRRNIVLRKRPYSSQAAPSIQERAQDQDDLPSTDEKHTSQRTVRIRRPSNTQWQPRGRPYESHSQSSRGYRPLDVLNDLGRRLEGEHDFSQLYQQYDRFFQQHNLENMPALLLLVARSPIPRRFLHKVIVEQDKVASLPSPEMVLSKYVRQRMDNEFHWADVMFDALQRGKEEEVLRIWSDYMKRLVDQGMLLSGVDIGALDITPPTTPAREASSKTQPPPPSAYPIVAALAAHLSLEYKQLSVPSLIGIFDVLQRNSNIKPSKRPYIPNINVIADVLNEYNVDPQLIVKICDTINTLRPYDEDLKDTQEISYLDDIFICGKRKNEGKLIFLFQNRPVYRMTTAVATAFIIAFMQCGNPKVAIEVWNELVRNMQADGKGNVPSLRTWGTLLDGFAKIRNMDLFDKTWNKMLESGLIPDEKCWTMRLQMLFLTHRAPLAKACLNEMISQQVPITTSIINVTISGLDNAKLYKDSQAILDWARKSGIKCDIITYNAILRSQLRRGKAKEANATLQLMLETNIQPDVITYSEIVSSMYMHATQPLSIEQLRGVIAEMAASSIKPNEHFFNSIMNSILRKFDNIDAAYDVLQLMPREWRISPITSNLFIQYHLSHHEFDAVDALWALMRKGGVVPDPAIYNVTITGYAIAGRRERMLYFLGDMIKDMKLPTVTTYIQVLRCLNIHNDLGTAAQIAHDVLQGGFKVEQSPDLKTVLSELARKGMVLPDASSRISLRPLHKGQMLASAEHLYRRNL